MALGQQERKGSEWLSGSGTREWAVESLERAFIAAAAGVRGIGVP